MTRTHDVREKVHLSTDDRRQVAPHSDRFRVLLYGRLHNVFPTTVMSSFHLISALPRVSRSLFSCRPPIVIPRSEKSFIPSVHVGRPVKRSKAA